MVACWRCPFVCFSKGISNNQQPSTNLPQFLEQVLTEDLEPSSHILSKRYAKINQIEREYLKACNTPNHAYCTLNAYEEHNLSKNRYSDIVPYDGNRVKLEKVGGINDTDYINASYVSLPNSPREYIVTQGPKPNTVGDFWLMIWQQKSQVIVMLTKVTESGRVKCEPYWPASTKLPLNFPSLGLTVYLLREVHIAKENLIVRTLHLVLNTPIQGCISEFTVTQYHTLDWPDHGVQSQPHTLLNLIQLTNKEQQKYTLESRRNGFKCGPMVVHCSAGCGRTGTFCTIDTVLSLLPKVSDDSIDLVFDVVRKLREQRRSMVQTVKQYEFCYVALLTEILSRNKLTQ